MSILSGIGYGGITYFENLIPALIHADSVNEYHIFLPKGHPFVRSQAAPNFYFHECIAQNRSALKRLLWEQLVLPRELKKLKIDIMFTAKNMNIFFAPCKTIVSVRNMEPFKYEAYENDWKLNIISWFKWQLTKVSLFTADHIVAVSKEVREVLSKRFPGIEKKTSVVYNGNSLENIHSSQTKGGETYAGQSYILTASKFVAYANQLNLIEAYSLLVKKGANMPSLLFAGGVHDKTYFAKVKKTIDAYNLDNRVKILGLVPHHRLIELMCSARAFVFPSMLEACPHTLIEAMACGVPIAASSTPPMPEIGGDGVMYFNPYDPKDMAEKIQQIHTNETVRTKLRSAALERVKFFNWDKTAQQLLEIFTNLQLSGTN